MAKLPKSIIKKYGISKKAWRVFRARKSSKSAPKRRRRSTKKKQVSTMAKRRRTARRRSAPSRRRRKGNSGNMQLLWMGVGSGLSGLAEGGVNKLTGGTLTGNVAGAAGGYALWKYASGPLSHAGKGMLVKAIGSFVEQNVAPKLGGLIGGATSTAAATTEVVV